MTYTIEGFLQSALVRLGLDATDAILLRWFVTFQAAGKMEEERGPDGKVYFWVKYPRVQQDLPILGLSSETLARRFRKMAEVGVLSHYHHKIGGSFSMYRAGEKFEGLSFYTPRDSNAEGRERNADPSASESRPPQDSNAEQNTLSLSYDSKEKKQPQDSPQVVLATLLLTEHRKVDTVFAKGKDEETVQRWAVDIEKLLRIDERSFEDVKAAILFSQASDFWCANVISGSKLRKQFPTLMVQANRRPKATPLFDDADAARFIDPLKDVIKLRGQQ